MTQKVRFGQQMKETQFGFAPSHTPLNHGAYGAVPLKVQERQREIQKLETQRPSAFIVYDLPKLIDKSRESVAPLLGASVDEVVFVPNAMTGINTALRNLKFNEKDVIVHFSTIYDACEMTIASIAETSPLTARKILLEYPFEDDETVEKLRETILQVKAEGLNPKIAIFDTISSFPGARMPWERMVEVCKELGTLSLVDGAHGIGHIDLTHMGRVSPDFFVSNCHNDDPNPNGKPRFVMLFEFTATMDYSSWCCVPAALEFRKVVCGGEEQIMKYSTDLATEGGARVAEILETEIMGQSDGRIRQSSLAMVRLPFVFRVDGEPTKMGEFKLRDASKVKAWLKETALKEFDTYIQMDMHAGNMWVRLSGQIYLESKDFEWAGFKLKQLCQRLNEVGLE